jgi:hypothetical protein
MVPTMAECPALLLEESEPPEDELLPDEVPLALEVLLLLPVAEG